MSKQKVNLDTYSLSLLMAKEDILNPRSSTNWALFTYDGFTNNLKLADSGAGGLAELAGKFHISKPQYGLCKVESKETGAPPIVMINWIGHNVDEHRRTECAGHISAIKSFFKEAHVFVSAEKVEDVTEETIRAELDKAQSHAPSQWVRRSSRSADKEEIVGTNYRKTNAALEMRRINRDSFWARAEREEEERKEEERRKAAEERRRLERERVLKEKREADERERKMNEKLQMIEEQRRRQAAQEEEFRRKEKFRWDEQQKEHVEDMRARLLRSESIEKAAEAAELVSQRTMNPREFFRQLSSSSSQSPTSPGSSRSGKPFRRYQRSLTDTAFIFCKAEESAASSPRSSPLVSPFSRAPPSPIYRGMSPPPDFFHGTKAPMSPSMSPLRPAPPVSALPSVPQNNNQVRAVSEPKASSPTEPSAPPASPTLLASQSPGLMNRDPNYFHSEALPDAPTPTEESTWNSEPILSPQVPQMSTDVNTASHVHTEQVSDTAYKVQAVLVEEDEEEDVEEHEEEQPEKQLDLFAVTTVQIETEEAEEEEREEGKEKEAHKEEDKEKEKALQNEEDKPEEKVVHEEETVEGFNYMPLEEPAEIMQNEEKAEEEASENNQSGDGQPLAESFSEEEEESETTDAKPICQDMRHETVILSTNGITNGGVTEEQNGTARSLSPSDTDCSTSEVTVCYSLHTNAEEDGIIEDEEQEISENGQEDSAERQMCVRALYDYQAGDIIRDVETVDKAWWRGWSKDGRQGLFPANYVETI
ncbi:drebrin-like protein A isoform X2 [Cololabis saira]|uniref:drebrin-like protein A isoform X2 n=1 Tax=Cololabis saira TaxID=129043 RepID=UPI002AD581CE|nr:drebrin-like protein A isoform X2 [Cololabis saira]